jgi:hypothetical protein
VEVGEGQRVIDADITMWRYASITGRVVDDLGEPIAGVQVHAVRRVVAAGRSVLSANAPKRALTDDRGVYRLSGLSPDDYAVAVPARLSTFPVEAVRDALTSGVSLGVAETAPLGDARHLQIGDLVITTMSGAPIPPAVRPGQRLAVFQTTFYPRAVAADQAAVISLASGEERSGVDIPLIVATTYRVAGRVVGPDGPVAMQPIRLVPAGGEWSESSEFDTATGLTNSDGTFALLGVPPGRYGLRLRTPSIGGPGTRPGASAPLFGSADVVVADADVADVRVNARPLARLTGRVEFVTGASAALEQIELIVQAFDAGPLRVVNPRLDQARQFTTLLLPGRYGFVGYAAGGLCASVTVNGADVGDALVTVLHEDVDVVFTCGAPLGRITGTVRDDRGQPERGARVVVFSADRRHWSGDDYRPARRVVRTASHEGRFSVTDLLAGEYFLAAIPAASRANPREAQTLEALSRSAERLTIVSGSTRAIDLAVTVIR